MTDWPFDEKRKLDHLLTRTVPLRDDVFRCRDDDGYNNSFALQWRTFKSNQIDAVSGTDLTARRFHDTGWSPDDLRGKLTLEAGCGAGRFTRLLAEAGADVVAIDYSAAVDVCREMNGHFPNVLFMQCDILEMPLRPESFEYVFCYGVLQHTSNPKTTFLALTHGSARWPPCHRHLSQRWPGRLVEVEISLAMADNAHRSRASIKFS